MTKRYMLFAGYLYYPYGGMNDFLGFVESPEPKIIRDRLRQEFPYECHGSYDWAHIYDVKEDKWEKIPSSELY